ncbi:hypothetical protein JA1_001437 [Spathaspora sp. JA1]|nr:hypothetical protein JA1_001437 [Spathaspora sp. JA1]
MKLFLLFNLLFLGVVSLDISSPTTSTSASISGVPLIIEPTGALLLVNAIQFVVTSFSVRSLGEFFFRTNSASRVDVQLLDNSGYILFDIRQINTLSLVIHNNNNNNGDLIIYGTNLDVSVEQITNTGSIIFWGQTGNLFITNPINKGSICFHSQLVQYLNPGGAGCFYLSRSTVIVNNALSDFIPTVVFDGTNNEFRVQTVPQVLYFYLINFGTGATISVPNSGYTSFAYVPDVGFLEVFISSRAIILNIGAQYDITKFAITTDATLVHIKYNDVSPSGANQGGCSCVLDIKTPPTAITTEVQTTSNEVEETTSEIETTSEAETTNNGPDHDNHDDKGNENNKGNNNDSGKGNGNSNGKGNDNENSKGNDKDKGNGNNGRGHKREIDADNSAGSSSTNPISTLIIIGSIWLAIV